MPSNLTRDNFRRPYTILWEILRKGASGLYDEGGSSQLLFRAQVVAIDVDGGLLENPDGSGDGISHQVDGKSYSSRPRIGPRNPPCSVKARVLTDGLDKFSTDENLRVFWPFFPEHMSVPVKPGEHVYVMFEDQAMTHGLWLSKVPGHEGINFAAGEAFYEPGDRQGLSEKFPDSKGVVGKDEKKFDKDQDAAETGPAGRLPSLWP